MFLYFDNIVLISGLEKIVTDFFLNIARDNFTNFTKLLKSTCTRYPYKLPHF